MSDTFNIVVFISGTGSNLNSILKKQEHYNYRVVLVVSNKNDAQGLKHAEQKNIPTYTFNWDKKDKELMHLQEKIKKHEGKLIVLAGFMKILPEPFVTIFKNQIINIHPSLLPKYPGLNTHKKALENKDTFHGATVHFVNEELDAGQVISQSKIKIDDNMTVADLASQLLFREHSLYPYTIDLIAQNRVKWINNHLYFDKNILINPIELND